MNAVLIPIHKQHNENIFTGAKRFEGRKSLPKGIEIRNYLDNSMNYVPSESDTKFYIYEPKTGGGCGKVVGEFICDYAQSFLRWTVAFDIVSEALCVSEEFAEKYFNRPIGYMLRICNPVRYDRPKELGEFKYASVLNTTAFGYHKPIEHAPQSWCKVEELEE